MSEQAAIEKNLPGTSGSDSADALDDLLNEFEQETGQTSEDKINSSDLKSVVQYVQEQRDQTIKQATEEGINSAVKTIKDGMEINVPDRAVRGMLFDLAESNEAFVNAFNNRDNNPRAWNKVLKSLQKEVAEEFNIDQNATNDNAALAAAVHSSKSTTPTTDEPADYSKMSDADFQKTLRDMGI